jgi:hypothetical protein
MGRRSSRGSIGLHVGIGLICMVLLASAGRGLARVSAPAFWPAVRFSSGWTLPIAPGISYSRFSVVTAAGPLSINHLRLDLNNANVRLGVGLARNRLISDDETVSSMVRRSRAIAGINGDYFDIHDSGMPLNITVKDGQFLRSPTGWAALGLGRDGRLWMNRYLWKGSVVDLTTNESYWLSGYNSGIVPDGLIGMSNVRGYGAPVPEPGVRQTVVVLRPATDPAGVLLLRAAEHVVPPDTTPAEEIEGRYVVREVWLQQAYYAPFPKDNILLVGRGTAADWLRRRLTAGTPVQVNLTTAPDWHLMRDIIGGGPFLVSNGRIIDDPLSPVPHEKHTRNPVSAIGVSRDGRTALLVEVDGRQRTSIGLTQPQLASYMQWLGAYQAMEFDSGGSATMVVRFPRHSKPNVVNSPSDGHERPVGDALLVYTAGPAAP